MAFHALIFFLLPITFANYPQGSINPDVTQDNLKITVCVPNWARSIRPSWSYTNRIKKLQMKAMKLTGSTADYEEDHIISLVLGGHPKDPNNLRPQLWNGPRGALAKDVLENELHRALCAGEITLEQARQSISAWEF